MATYAVIRSGSKQYRVQRGDIIDVERIPGEVGSTVELEEVLLLSTDGKTEVGRPRVEGAKVLAQIQEQGKDDKIVVFKFKAKTRYRRKAGHRQLYTRLVIKDIVRDGS